MQVSQLLSNGYGNSVKRSTITVTMDRVVDCAHLCSKKKRAYNTTGRIKKGRACRRRDFAKRQSQERLMFALLLSVAALTLQSPVRSLWVKQRSSYWWDHVVNSMFTPCDYASQSKEITRQ